MTSPPSLGDLVYLASYVFQVDVEAITTMPDTPNQYSATLKVMGDSGEMDLSGLVGLPGPAGVARFALRDQTSVLIVNTVEELPTLEDTYNDIGKYWLLDTLDDFGGIIMKTAYVWYGTSYRPFMMGTFGPPGPVPSIQPSCQVIAPTDTSYVKVTGPTFQPSWIFELAVPRGPVGETGPMVFFPDVDEGGIQELNVLTATGFLESGEMLWQPLRINGGGVAPYSMPEGSFLAYTGISQQAPIGSFVIPPQPFPWTPVVWGHVGGIGGQGLAGLLGLIIDIGEDLLGGLSASPLSVGCEVLLGNATTGIQVARGFGNQVGVVNLYPNYSTATNRGGAITPTNNMAVVPANHTDPAEGTLYVNLYNDGLNDFYSFTPGDAQLFIWVCPIGAPFTSLTGVPRAGAPSGSGVLSAPVSVLGKAAIAEGLSGKGTLSVTAFARGG